MTANDRLLKSLGVDHPEAILPAILEVKFHPPKRSAGNPEEGVYDWSEIASRLDHISRRRRADRVFFYRHGATNYNRRNLVSGQHNTQLSDEGRAQALQLRHELPEKIDLIVCSALARSIETMALSVPNAIKHHVPIVLDPRLNEVNLGVLQGRRRRHLPEFDAGDIDFAPTEGESYRQAAHRVLSVIVDIFDRLAEAGPSPRNAAVFCHAGVLRIIATLKMHSNDPKDVFQISLGNAEGLQMSAKDVTLPSYWKGRDAVGSR